MALTAVLTGTYRTPELRFSFVWGTRLPNGKPAQDWVKDLPGRRWDKSEKAWYITGTGGNPDKVLAKAGVEVDFSEAEGDLAGLDSLEPLWRPLVKRSKRFPATALVRPRLAGFERVNNLLGLGAVWDKKTQRFNVQLSDLITDEGPKRGLIMDDETYEAAVQTLQRSRIPQEVQDAARELARSTGVEGENQQELSPRTQELIDIVAAHTGYLPKWFGLSLFPFQVAGAYAILGGHHLLADAPGLGKCVLPETKILANGAYTSADELWEEAAAAGPPHPDHDGVGEIIELTPGKLRVQSLNGSNVASNVSASHLYRERITARVKSIKTASGALITATMPHKFLTSRGWRSDIKPGDMIAVPDNTPFEVSHPNTSLELARFMAWQIGEGYEHKVNRLEITNNDTTRLASLIKDFQLVVEQLGLHGQSCPRIVHRSPKCPHLVVGASPWRRWLESNGYSYGRVAAGKSIPSFIMGAHIAVQREFLANYFSAEGSFSLRSGVLEIASASRLLMLQLQTMLSRFGVAMNIADRQKCATNGSRIMRTYTVGVVTGEDILSFRHYVGFADNVKNGRLDEYREAASSNVSRRIPCIDVVREFVDAGVPARTFGRSGSLTSTLPRAGVTRTAAQGCIDNLRAISDGSLKRQYEHRPKHRWTLGAITAIDHIPAGRASAAAELIEGMMSTNVRWTLVTSVDYSEYDGWVYDLTVPDGANYIAEGLWCHNTRQSLAAAAIRRSRRTVIVVPPLVVENWCREANAALGPGLKRIQPKASGNVVPIGSGRKSRAKKKKAPADTFPPYIVPIRAGKKVPPFPEAGVVVVADSLLGSRPELLDQLAAWNPQTALFDEIHRARTWGGLRATADRNLACSIDDLRVPITGTPFMQKPAEITNPLAIAGVLDPIFGGPSKFLDRYTKQNRFGALLPNRKMLPELEQRLSYSCWVQRNKQDVLKQLPAKLRTMRFVDIDPRGFREAHETLYEKITEWIDEQVELGEPVNEQTITSFAKQRIDLITPLRAAAGIAKVPAAIEIIKDWLERSTETNDDGTKRYTRPLTVWVHHQPVMDALVSSVPEDLAGVGFIDGGVPQHKRQMVADKLQNGEIGVIVCSIGAAGFGITLTASSDAFFVETDWTPANISQAEDRNHRIGQTEVCMVTTLMAANTLDAHMRAILKNKAKDLNVLLPGADNNVTEMTAVLNEDDNSYDILTEEDKELEKRFKSLPDIIAAIAMEILSERVQQAA